MKIKSCRIYTDLKGGNVLLYYTEGKKYPTYVDGGTIDELKEVARKLGIKQYFLQYSDEIQPL